MPYLCQAPDLGLPQIALGLVFLPPIIAAVTLILKNTGPLVALYLWFFILVVSLFMMTIYPVAIAPLFNKFTPLPEGSLRSGLLTSTTFPTVNYAILASPYLPAPSR